MKIGGVTSSAYLSAVDYAIELQNPRVEPGNTPGHKAIAKMKQKSELPTAVGLENLTKDSNLRIGKGTNITLSSYRPYNPVKGLDILV